MLGLGLAGICLGVGAAAVAGWIQARGSGSGSPPFPVAGIALLVIAALLSALLPLAVVGTRVAALGANSSVEVVLVGLILGTAIGALVHWARLRSRRAAVRGVPAFPVLAPTVGLPACVLLVMLFSGSSTPHGRPGPIGSPSPSARASAAPRCTSTPVPVATIGQGQLLASPWLLKMSDQQGARECYQNVPPNVLQGRTTLRVTFDLHGMHASGQDASALVFDQGGDDACVNRSGCRWHYISLTDYAKNDYDGEQTATIPLSAFPGLDLTRPLNGVVHTRFWASSPFTVEIQSIVVT